MIQIFDTDEAELLGIRGAILLMQFRYWIWKNKANNRHFHDGRTWTYNSVRSFEAWFYYMTPKQIRSTLDDLIKRGFIMTGNYNLVRYDRTTWYAFVDEEEQLEGFGKTICRTGQMDSPQRANGIALEGEPIPHNKPHNKPEKKNALLLPIWKKRLSAIFNRRETRKWDADEEKALDEACPLDDDELALVEKYYASERKKEKNYCRRTLLVLLRHWAGEVDRARAWAGRKDFAKRRKTQGPQGTPVSDEEFKRLGAVAKAEMERFKKSYHLGVQNEEGDQSADL